VLLLAPAERQSAELAAKVFAYYDALGQPVPARKRTELQLHLVNGSRCIALPGSEKTIRGYSGARILIADEAALISDSLYFSVKPMLAVSKGRLLAMSTPFGKRGWFYEAWAGDEKWERVRVPAQQCSRIPASFLEESRRSMGPRWYRQVFETSFEDSVGQVFADSDIDRAISDKVLPLTFE